MPSKKTSRSSRAPVEPCLFVVFGATGDLMRRKLLPALYHLAEKSLLPHRYQILGVARAADLVDTSFSAWAREALADVEPTGGSAWCDDCVHYHPLPDTSAESYSALAAVVEKLDRNFRLQGNRVFYLALPPGAFPGTIEGLGKGGLNRSEGWTRIVIEKPFGRDLASAQELNALIHRYFDENQVYRIDHYLGKETVQNLLAFRFGNALFESAWNRDHIRNVQIIVAEQLGIEQRAGYYEHAGALRDMVQNHLTQLLSLTAMEVPAAFEAASIRFEKIKVLRSIAPLHRDAVVRGQYMAGNVGNAVLAGYRQEPGVSATSMTETFVAMRLEIENWRWQGVPFYLQTGKRLHQQLTQITINFRSPPVALFRSLDNRKARANTLVITLQPDEGFSLSFEVKSPGEHFKLETQHMHFHYTEAFGTRLESGYETLLLDIMEGDQTLFVHAEETEASWRLYTPILQSPGPLAFYEAGSSGPGIANSMGPAHGRRKNDRTPSA